MTDFGDAFATAFRLIAGLDPDLMEIVLLSLRVSLTAVGLATLLGLPLGAAVALFRFPGRLVIAALLNAFMGLPPVVIGLMVYLLLSRCRATDPWGFSGCCSRPPP
jgi:tungstate transport system permease protein